MLIKQPKQLGMS